MLVTGDTIAGVGHFSLPNEARIIDCAGLVIAPGFIDAHSHSDLQVLENRSEKVQQGVTTEIVGNCGFSAYPTPRVRKLLHEFANGYFAAAMTGVGSRPRSTFGRPTIGKINEGRVTAWNGALRLAHMRTYTSELLPAIDEQLELAMRSGCKLEISHLQAAGPENWPKQSMALEKIEGKLGRGRCYFRLNPYTAGSTVLT